ncbi:MAG TPA: LamG-like jellyroll fold domain-containing protein [Longimicrobium sp.]
MPGTIVNPPFVGYPVCLSFDGTGSYVSLGNPASLAVTGTITVQAWIRPNGTAGLQNIVAHGYTRSPDGELYLRILDGRYQVGSWNGSDHFTQYAVPPEDVGQWVHLCGTFDGSAWTLYRNGVQVARSPESTGAVAVGAEWAIGARGGGSERFFYGMIRNVALWSTARTAPQVAADMYAPPAAGDAGLAGFWALDHGSGTVADDRSGNANHGRVVHAAWLVPTQPLPATLVLPKTPRPGYVSLGNPAKLNFSGAITLMAWVMPHNTAGLHNLVAHGYTVNPNAEVYFRILDGRYQVGSWNGTDYVTQYTVPPEDIMQWVHLCGTWDGANWTLYRNGVQVAQSPAGTGAITVPAGWAIGARGDGSERYAQACVRSLAIWRRALSAGEVVKYIQQPITGSENGLAGYWPLDEGAGLEVFDRAPNPANGTLVNAGWVDTPGPPGWFLATPGGMSRNLPVVLTFQRQIWAMAGQYQNVVYSSSDGVLWSTATTAAPWAGRGGAAGVVFQERMWLLGGSSVGADWNDVWWSPDGESWTCATAAAPWTPRSGLCAEVFGGKIWVFGGSDRAGNVYNDVWWSADGASWTRATSSAAWSPRDSGGSAVFGGKLWLFGGSNVGNGTQDAWASADGVTWTAAPTPPWPSRFGPNVEIAGGMLLLMGGTSTGSRELGDMWSTADGVSWTQLYASSPWFPRPVQGTTVFNDRVYLLGDIVNQDHSNACWYYVPKVAMRAH